MRIPETHSGAGPGTVLHRYFFATPALRLRFDLVRDYIQNTDKPVLITGEAGAGKTTCLEQIVCRADSCWRPLRMPAVASFSADEVVRFLTAELRLPTSDSSDATLRELEWFLNKTSMRGRIAVVIVDDAHNLSDASLVRLATLGETLECSNYRVLMTGLPALRARLTALLASRERPVRPHVVTIPSLDSREVASYIDMKLYYSGFDGRRPFSRSEIDDIARSSRGHPGRIDAITDALLSNNRRRNRRSNCRKMIGCSASGRFRRLVSQLSESGANR